MFRRSCFIICVFFFEISYSQTIINTEAILKEIDSTFALKLNLEGNANFGNIKFSQLNNSISLGKKIKKSFLRLSIGHEYISENQEVLANDLTGQFRYNRFFDENSFFLFLQAQNAISLKLNHRYLVGTGYRHRIFKKKINYLDASVGVFFEDELYEKGTIAETLKHNYRYSLSAFSNFLITQKISLNTSIYYQINTKDFKDKRLYFEPRLYFDLNIFNIYMNFRYRHHTTPYVEISKSDFEILYGIELDL